MKYLSLFTGIGGFELGIQQASFSNHVTLGEFDEFVYDPKTNSYRNRAQDEVIHKLKDEIEKSKQEKRQDLENIIGYFYARK